MYTEPDRNTRIWFSRNLLLCHGGGGGNGLCVGCADAAPAGTLTTFKAFRPCSTSISEVLNT